MANTFFKFQRRALPNGHLCFTDTISYVNTRVKQSLYVTLLEHVVARLFVTQTLVSVEEIP